MHWRAHIAADNDPPYQTRCFADPDQAVLYLANELAGHEADATEGSPRGDSYCDLAEEYRAGFKEMGERFADLTRGDKDPAEWVGCGPAVLVDGFNYVIEVCDGADCRVRAGDGAEDPASDWNAEAQFFAKRIDDDSSLPCVEIGGVQVYVYVEAGELRISVHYDDADPELLTGPGEVPTRVILNGTDVHVSGW